ncbi:uncharacterized protein LOC18425659 isoform X1 [Amborella trichopoda]|uniref:uncharacterized protein LOC18425659 isoform X1 n=1 Tax=Amborella trichopoda TaxID=13333 RepID=UPI0009C18D18|nr:uncharacterized protein LOC18425659 isoform X1 [Amborella trichopoda]|eukprot:XP_020517793.1 uncharacterized protein LOC18425659 isoform X1 [Amborella trichopoda]
MVPEGAASPKLLRLLSFIGAGVICTAAINVWSNIETNRHRKTFEATERAQESSQVVKKADLGMSRSIAKIYSKGKIHDLIYINTCFVYHKY